MNRKSWLIALLALIVGGAAVAITRGTEEDTTAAAPPADTARTETEKTSDKKDKKDKKDKSDKASEQTAEQQVEQTVNAYVDALAAGDTEALCDIQAESLTVNVTASGGSGDEIAHACAEAAAHFDWAELWAAWARQIDLDDVQVNVDGAQASVSLTGGAGFSLDRQRSGEWKIDGVNTPGPARSAPQGGGGLSSGGDVPSPQAPQRPQPPELPQLPQR